MQAAVRLAGTLGWTSSCVINLSSGSFSPFPDATGDTMVVPQGFGDSCGPLLFKGVTIDSGLGTLVATGGTAGVVGTTWQAVTTAAVAGSDNDWRGWFAVFAANTTTVALRGHVVPIAKQTAAGVWTFAGSMTTQPVAGDTFTVVKPNTILLVISAQTTQESRL